MISFIVTTYNLEDWLLRRCLNSIVTQGLARDKYEIIVVDDESVISPQPVVDEFSMRANISLYVQKHARQGAARNLGLHYAKGEWIQFVDGDDFLYAGSVPLILHTVQSLSLDLLIFGYNEVNDDDLVECVCQDYDIIPRLISDGNAFMYCNNLFGSCWTLLFRRRLLDDSRYGVPLRFTEGIYVEDEEFVTRLVWRAQYMTKLDVPVYAYYQRSDSTIHCCTEEHTDELFRNFFIVLERLICFEADIKELPHEGVTRKIRYLAVDAIRRSLRTPDWERRLMYTIQRLKILRLFPLPFARYSFRYMAFRIMSLNCIGRRILHFYENIHKNG